MKSLIIKTIVVVAAVVLSVTAKAAEVILITSQNDFEQVGAKLNASLKRGETDIRIVMARGTYYYQNNHIDLAGKEYPNANVCISGNGVVCIAKGERYLSGSAFKGQFSYEKTYLDDKLREVSVWTPLYQTKELVEVVSSTSKLCRIRNLAGATAVSPAGSYIQITSWYQSFVYKIERLDKDYIYFTATNLAKGFQGGWNVNNDYNFGKCYPRYRLCNVDGAAGMVYVSGKGVRTPDGIKSVYECEASRFLVLGYGTKLGSLTVSGITFLGNARDGEMGVFSLLSPQCKATISNCSFNGLKSSRAITVGNKNNVSITDCRFEGCAESCVISSHNAENTIVKNCTFKNCGDGLRNSFCVWCFGTNYYVGHNTFEDYGYSAIGLGYGAGNEHKYEISGVVEYNTLRYSDSYMANIDQHTLMDNGAIYISTQNDNTTIRYNVIDQFSGMYENRGIFCDDGASNLKIYGNVITGVANFYSIDSRRVASVEAKSGPSNVGNVIRDNVVDGAVQLVGREGSDNGCEYGTNYFLVRGGNDKPAVKTGNVTVTGEDVVVEHTGEKRGKVAVSRQSYKALKKSPEWKKLKKNVARK